jgi:AcrR family transcriptional regulator/DNA-binding transcriptional ArsR family regulator
MAGLTVKRAQALMGRIGRLETEPAREAVALGLVDAVLERDGDTLAAALDAFRDARARADTELAGWLEAAIAFAHWGLERVPSQHPVAQGTQAHDFLAVLEGTPQLSSTELRRRLEVDETQVSRTGRRLLESGLVMRRKVGRQVFWELTPRGQRALADAPRPRANADFWQEALRRGFDAVYGDEPGEPRQVDPTRERIIECSLELHGSQGIQATTWPQIAAKAGVPLGTVEALFPTLEELARGCAEHFLERLRLPPLDRVPDVFAGAASEHERIHRLVETFFGAYERGADGLAAGRRERTVARAVDESVREVESTLDALVVEAVHPDSASVASLRALTDLEVWRALRHQGATPAAAVEEASGAVERWLAGH